MSEPNIHHDDCPLPHGSGFVIALLLGLPGLLASGLLWAAGASLGLILLCYFGLPALSLGLMFLFTQLPARPRRTEAKWAETNV